MIVKQIIDKKREGKALEEAEIREFIDAFTKGEILDSQMSALAMAICCRGMTTRETAILTDAMMRSGVSLDWGEGAPTADKHSTGGIGDKLSLVIQPLAASCGLRVPSLTGRGLGITGGTADKLESIPGFNASLSLDEMRKVVEMADLAMTVQTAQICPADKKLYALRDVTGTVASVPLITGSILSKKFAEGSGTLVFDVKTGKGAFMKTMEEAEELARSMVEASKASGRKSMALITDMNNPLGYKVGNANEVEESIEMLTGGCKARKPALAPELELCVEFAAWMVSLALGKSLAEARALAWEKLESGEAKAKFEKMVASQGGSFAKFREVRSQAKIHRLDICAARAGYIKSIDAYETGLVALDLGAGRGKCSDTIDIHAGIDFALKVGDKVEEGEKLATLATSTKPEVLEKNAAKLLAAINIGSEAARPQSLVFKVIE